MKSMLQYLQGAVSVGIYDKREYELLALLEINYTILARKPVPAAEYRTHTRCEVAFPPDSGALDGIVFG